MKNASPTIGYLNRLRRKPEFEISKVFWGGIVKQDFTSREKSIAIMRKTNEQMEQLKFEAAQCRQAGDIDRCHKLTRSGDALKHCIRALQAWHYDRYFTKQLEKTA